MASLIHIRAKNAVGVNKQILNFLSPDYVYIPFTDDYKLYVKSNDYINKEDILLYKDNKYIYSSVSGKVLGAATMHSSTGTVKTIVIENDFREKTKAVKGVKKQINKYTKTDVLTLVRNFNAYYGDLQGHTLVVNGIDEEPFVATSSYIISEYTNEILETIDALYTIFDIHKCFFAIKNNDSENVESLVNHIGTYPNINLKLMPDLYPLGREEVLINELVLPSKLEAGIIYLTVEDVYAIYNVLKKAKPITEKLITITGNLLSKAKVVNVKIGSSLKDILVSNFKIKGETYKIVVNGLMSGYEIDTLDFIITPDIKSIFINSVDEKKALACINCGMCHTKCPVGADPRSGFQMNKCIKCGVCTYICPAKINFKERQAK